jgi:hypothetical protein
MADGYFRVHHEPAATLTSCGQRWMPAELQQAELQQSVR